MDCPKDLCEWVNSDPKIVWFLYDIDLLPEVIKTKEQVCALRGFMYGWVAREKSAQQSVHWTLRLRAWLMSKFNWASRQ